MYSVSNDYLTKIASASRQFVARMSATNGFLVDSDNIFLTDADGYFLINGVVPETQDIDSSVFKSFTVSGGTNSEQDFSIGSCVAQCLTVELSGNTLITQGAEYLLEIGLVLDDDSVEYIPIGLFIAQKPETTEYTTTATLYDRMILAEAIAADVSTLAEATTTLAVLELMSETIGVPVDTTDLASISMARPDSTKSWREILSSIAQLYGGFAVADRSGNICIKKYDFDTTVATIGADRYTKFTHADENYTLLNIYVTTGYDADGAEISFTSGTGEGGIFIENANMTQALLDSIYAYYENMSYMPSEIESMLGRPEIDVWDCISVTDQNSTAYTVPLMARELHFDGGLTDSISAYGKSEAEQINAYQSVFSNLLKQTNGLLNIVAKKINFAVEGQYLSSTFEISDSAITSITDKFVIKGSDGTTTVISGGEIQANTITADELNVSTLSAISANLGTVTAGTIKNSTWDDDGMGVYFDLSTPSLEFASDTNLPAASISIYEGGLAYSTFAIGLGGTSTLAISNNNITCSASGTDYTSYDALGINYKGNRVIGFATDSDSVDRMGVAIPIHCTKGGTFIGEYLFDGDTYLKTLRTHAITPVNYGTSYYSFLGTSSSRFSYLYVAFIGSSSSYTNTAYITNIYGTVVGTSDRDAKTEISELNPEKSAEFIYSLKPCEYKFKDGTSGRKHHGLIAQEVKESMGADDWGVYVDQNAKTESDADKIENPLGLRYSEFIADLIATVQSQNERITALENKIKELEVSNNE